jgi:hypothetical protein
MPNTATNLQTFYADPTHANLWAVEDHWIETMVRQALEKIPSGYFSCVAIVRSDDRTYVLAARKDETTGNTLDYAHWMVAPCAHQKISDPKVEMNVNGGYYGFPTLTHAIASLSDRIGRMI